jgi:hypothetical protein
MFDLNDPSEVRHGFSLAVSSLSAKAETGPPESKLFASQMDAFGTQGGIQASAHYFVCSFSPDGDDLGQWRAYADNDRGYALGFDASALEDAYTKANGRPVQSNSTIHVTYDDKQLAALHQQIVDLAFPLISLPRGRNLESSVLNEYMSTLSVLVCLHTLRASLFFKHEAYRSEREYHFMQLHRADVAAPDVKLRARRHSFIRFREFDWKSVAPHALTHIIVGPAADFRRAERFAQECCRMFNTGSVKIIPSKIPYRAT